MNPRIVRVQFEDGRGHDVLIAPGVLRAVAGLVEKVLGPERKVFLVHDQGVPQGHADRLTTGLALAGRMSWDPSETIKRVDQTEQFCRAMSQSRLDRSGLVVALGGGITGDVAGFAAAVYQRGIPWVNCPSTLLAMVDASVGGKTGVNLAVGDADPLKNMIGAFHQPILVVADIDLLESLSARQFRCGLAECIKHAMIGADWGEPGLFEWMRGNLAAIVQRRPEVTAELVARNIAIKAAVVQADEREAGLGPSGGRMALNLGHTFAHAIEPLPGLSPDGELAPLQHGEAVALGLVAASRCSVELGLWSSGQAERVTGLIRDCGLPVAVRGLPATEELIHRMGFDKKAQGGRLRLILPCEDGRVRVVENPDPAAVRAGLAAIRA